MCDCKRKKEDLDITEVFYKAIIDEFDLYNQTLLQEIEDAIAKDLESLPKKDHEYNVVKVSELERILEVSVVGFDEDEVRVVEDGDKIRIHCKKKPSDKVEYTIKKLLVEDVDLVFEVTAFDTTGGFITRATLNNGILSIYINGATQKKSIRNIPVNKVHDYVAEDKVFLAE